MAEKENIARFEGVIMKQKYSEAGTNTEAATTAQVIDEATGNVIAEAGAGSGSDSNSIILKISDPEGTYHYTIDSPVEFSTLMQTYWQYDKIDAIEVEAGFQSAVNVQFYPGESPYISMEFIMFDLTDAQSGVVPATFQQFIWNGTTVTRKSRGGSITLSNN